MHKKLQRFQSPASRNVLANYSLGRTIGKGTFCKVKLARHLESQQEVAVKILDKNKLQDPKDLDRIHSCLLYTSDAADE